MEGEEQVFVDKKAKTTGITIQEKSEQMMTIMHNGLQQTIVSWAKAQW